MFTVATKKRARRASQTFLVEMGAKPNRKGFYNVAEAIAIVAEFPETVLSLRDDLFPKVQRAKGCNLTHVAMKKQFENAIDDIFKACPHDKLQATFGPAINPKGGLTITQFLSISGIIIRERVTKARGDYL